MFSRPTFLHLRLLHLFLLLTPTAVHSTPVPQPSPSPASSPNNTLTWHACPATFPPGMECSTLTVPLTWTNPTGPTIDLFLSRLPCTTTTTTNQTRPRTLHYNPGGPGAPTASIWFPATLTGAWWFSADLRAHFDLVAFDPRGTGLSGGVACDVDLYNQRGVGSFPETEAEFESMRDLSGAVGRSCEAMSGEVFGYLDTTEVARDLEALRVALLGAGGGGGDGDGEGEGLTYLGQSYGTLLGSRYLELFPGKNVRAMAFDGVVDYSIGDLYTVLSDVRNLELTLRQWERWCTVDAGCVAALAGEGEGDGQSQGQGVAMTPGEVFDAVVQAAEAENIPAPGCVESGVCREDVTMEEVVLGVQQFLFTPFATGSGLRLGVALGEALKGNATLLSVPFETEERNVNFYSLAIACSIWQYDDVSYEHYRYVRRAARLAGERVRGVSQFGKLIQTCSGWPIRSPDRPHRLNISDSVPPILLSNALYDPATSYEWAVSVQEQIPGSVLLARNGTGHTSYQVQGESSRWMDRYLIGLELPEGDTVVAD